ncbi:CD5 protein, partial [Podilymbus podiceps]|nr:CD5 protein [Podilymbus podiceps]
LQLTGGGCRCAEVLEVKWEGRWNRMCWDSTSEAGTDGICQQLGCGPPVAEPLQVVFADGKEPRTWLLRCLEPAATSARCHWMPANCTEHAALACSEVVKTTPKPPPVPPTTSPEPTGPARLRLVDGNFSCSGFVELHREGLWGAVADSPAVSQNLATRICQALGCGSAIYGQGHAKPERESHLPVRWEVAEPSEGCLLLDCFKRTSARRGKVPAFIICSGSQPQALRRLGAGPTPCEGDVEVFHEGRWRVLCDNRERRAQWGRQLCRELRCGNLSSSVEIQTPPSMGLPASASAWAQGSDAVTPGLSPGQDSKPRPAGTAAGTIVSICLALLLFGLLLLICGPPAYRRLMKR